MSEQQHNINPWAEKLQQVSLPEPGEPKRRLLELLDREMPPSRKEKKRWLLVLLFLLLLLGVCNCPGGRTGLNRQAINHKHATARKEDVPAANNISYPPAKIPVRFATDPQEAIKQPGESGHTAPHSNVERKKPGTGSNRSIINGNNKEMIAGRSKQDYSVMKQEAEGKPAQEVLPAVSDTSNGIDSSIHVVNGPSAAGSTPQKKKDTSAVASKKKATNNNKKGWSAAIGLNQSIPVGNRQWTSPAIGDYIPVPQLQYRFNKKWSIQVELALHSPQYTPPLLLRQEKDSLGGIRRTLTLQKLYYLRVPVDIQYDFNDHWSAGGGISFGRLMDAIGLYETRVTSGSLPGSMASKTTQSLKKDTTGILYRQFSTSDWQWFATLNYRWKKLSVGMRYNQSWSNFINWPPVTGGPPAKGANASLQLSVQYTLWQQKHKKKQ